MKESTFKIVVLALLLVVFAAVVITARWTDRPEYDHVSFPSGQVSSQEHPPQHQTSSHGARAEAGKAASEVASATSWTDLNGYSLDEARQQDLSGKAPTKRLAEEPDDGGEPPDNSKYTYGDNDVE